MIIMGFLVRSCLVFDCCCLLLSKQGGIIEREKKGPVIAGAGCDLPLVFYRSHQSAASSRDDAQALTRKKLLEQSAIRANRPYTVTSHIVYWVGYFLNRQLSCQLYIVTGNESNCIAVVIYKSKANIQLGCGSFIFDSPLRGSQVMLHYSIFKSQTYYKLEDRPSIV